MAYATVEEAGTYVATYYSSTDNARVRWEALSAPDKQILLNRSEQVIDLLPFKGIAAIEGKAFPREPNKELSLSRARVATIELAVQTHSNAEFQERLALQKQGVKSYKIGDLSETFKDVSYDNYIDQFVLDVVGPYLKDWLGGGFRICRTLIRR